ncbi:MAG: MFS transporter [Trebonia sp.]|uniref:MFS transporter n=4 Tax=Trebonia sp. TaxID=2767075 RepID=UPI003BB09155
MSGRFAKLWTASTLSALGTGLTVVAAPLYVSARTSNALIVSATTGVAMLPWLLFALPAGVLVDRVDRRRLMVAVDWARAAGMGLLAVAIVGGWSSIVLLDLVLFLINTGETAFEPAAQSMVPAVVAREQLERANGWLVGGLTLSRYMIAGPLGGFLFIVAASIPFFANAGTYAASAVLVGLVGGSYRVTRPDTAGRRLKVRAEVTEGLRWLLKQRMLRTMAILIGLLNITLAAATAVLVLLAKERLHVGSVGYGSLFTCMAVGSLLGSAVGDRVIRRVTATWTIRIGLLVEALTHLTLALATNVYVVGVVLAVFGIHAALWTIVGTSLRQRLTPAHMLGRVSSANLFISAGGNFAGALLGGALAGAFGITAPYWVGFVVALIVAATTWRVFDRATVAAAYAEPAVAEA